MSSLKYFYATLAAIFVCVSANGAQAASCTVSGYVRYEPADRYYCDTNSQVCTGWLQVDLDRYRTGDLGAKPQRYMRLSFWNGSGTRLATTYTNASGYYSATVTVPGSSCAGASVQMQREYARAHESDIALGSPRFRFKLTLADKVTVRASALLVVPLTGSTTTYSVTQAADDSLNGRLNSVYYIMDAAVAEASNWWSTLSTRLSAANATAALSVVVDQTFTSTSYSETSDIEDGTIWLKYAEFASGGQLRHEFGHRIHQLLHNKAQTSECLTYTGPHGLDTCGYGFVSTTEGIASFFAARTITSADTNVWFCWKEWASPQDQCSFQTNALTGDTDGDGVQASNRYAIYGDVHVTSNAVCTVPNATSCACGGSGQPVCAAQSTRNSFGFRIETQVARFLWDIIDSNNESGLDDTDMTAGTFVQALAGMSCSGSGDGSCNEPNVSSCTAASRDKYNAKDIDDLLPGDQSQEMALNCVAAAPD